MDYDVDCLLVGYLSGDIELADDSELTSSVIEKEEKYFNGVIAYLGTYLHRRGFLFEYINYIEDEYDQLVKKINTKKIMAIGVSTTFCTNVDIVRRIVESIRKISNSIKIIVGGTLMSKLLNENSGQNRRLIHFILKQINADFYINSFQGEAAMVDILKSLKGEIPVTEVPNIYYLHEDKYQYSYTIPEDNSLEDNMIDWNLFRDRVNSVVPVRTSISCPFNCTFCGLSSFYGKHSYVSVKAIVQELDVINTIDNVKAVYFVDPTLNVPLNRYRELLRLLIKNKYKFEWFSYIRCQFLDDETAELMKASRCAEAILGIESGSQKMLDNMNKQVKIEELRKGIALLNKYEINITGLFFVGFPGETEETIKETISFIQESNFNKVFIQPWYYDTDTPISKEKERYGLTGSFYNWSHKTMDYQTAKIYVSEMGKSIANCKISLG